MLNLTFYLSSAVTIILLIHKVKCKCLICQTPWQVLGFTMINF